MFAPRPEYVVDGQALSTQARSYYNNVMSPTSPALYPAFDPISVLASLAFLAFLLQSFASLFDRSRSIVPTVVSGRKSPEQLDAVDRVERQVFQALKKYANDGREEKKPDLPL